MSTVWLNGDLVAADAARIDPRDRGFLLGDGVFETFAAADGHVYRLAEHLARLGSEERRGGKGGRYQWSPDH